MMLYLKEKTVPEPRKPQIGDRIYWEGDMANAPRAGKVIALIGQAYMTVEWDEAESVGWERDGTPVEIRDKFARGLPQSTMTGPRWHYEDEYKAERQRRIEEFRATVAKMRGSAA
jgi:hypothetical protein